jgi:hypothetical protein
MGRLVTQTTWARSLHWRRSKSSSRGLQKNSIGGRFVPFIGWSSSVSHRFNVRERLLFVSGSKACVSQFTFVFDWICYSAQAKPYLRGAVGPRLVAACRESRIHNGRCRANLGRTTTFSKEMQKKLCARGMRQCLRHGLPTSLRASVIVTNPKGAASAVHCSETAAPDLGYRSCSVYQGCGLPGTLTRNV